MKQLQNPEELGPRVKAVLEYVFEHPRASVKEIAKVMGVSEERIYKIRKHPKFQAHFPAMARKKLKEAVPQLTGRFLELAMQNENLGVAEKVVARALDSQKVLESTPQTQINVFQTMSIDELKRKLDQSSIVPGNVVDTTITSTSPELGSDLSSSD